MERELLHAGQGFDWSELQQAGHALVVWFTQIIDLRLRTGKPGREGAGS